MSLLVSRSRNVTTLQLLRYCFKIGPESLFKRTAIAAQSIRNRFATAVQLLRYRCAIAAISVRES
jgi:hypothetical protein